MSNHVHISLLHAFTTFLQLIPLFFIWRLITVYFADSTVGKAMAFVY